MKEMEEEHKLKARVFWVVEELKLNFRDLGLGFRGNGYMK